MTKEIELSLRGTYVKNVYSLGTSQVLKFGSPGVEDVWVVASPKLGVWVSKEVSERAETTRFTTKLRQELVRAKFVSAAQVANDRVFDLSLGEPGQTKHLIVELMPPGNISVTDKDLRVLVVLNEVRSQSRRLTRGSIYASPPQRRKDPGAATVDDVSEAIAREDTAGAAIGRNFSLPRKYVAEVLARLGLQEESKSTALRSREQEVVDALAALVREAHSAPNPCVCETPNGDDVFVLAPLAFRAKSKTGTVSEICDKLFLAAAMSKTPATDAPSGGKRRELEATMLQLKKQERGFVEEAARIRSLAARAREAKSVSEAREVMASAGVKDRREPASQEAAASSLFDRAKELERKAEDARTAAEDLSRRREATSREKPRSKIELRKGKQEWYEKFRWFFTSAGRLAVGGRDAQSNSLLVKRHLEANDTVYHADLFGSPFFILKEGRQQTDEECAEVAQATVTFSSAWKTGLGSADAYWVNSDQVSTAAPSGEYLPRGGFLLRGKKNFIPRNLVELTVGIDSKGRVVSGPEGALRNTVTVHLVLRPQREKSSETAKRVLKDLEALCADRMGVHLTVDDVLRMLPAGGGKVLRKYSMAAERLGPRKP